MLKWQNLLIKCLNNITKMPIFLTLNEDSWYLVSLSPLSVSCITYSSPFIKFIEVNLSVDLQFSVFKYSYKKLGFLGKF